MDSDEAIRVEYKGGADFEILVKPDEAFKYKRGEIDDFEKILFVREVFKDAGAADRASTAEVEDEFGTANLVEAAREIFEGGEMELTTDQKNQLREEKWKQLVSMIARQAMNPKTNSPHPPNRIENAMNEAGVNVDPMQSAEDQFEEIVEKLRPILPISLEEKEVAVKIPNEYAGKCYGTLKENATVLEEEWGDAGFMAKLKLPAGMKEKLVSELQSICHGDAEIRDI